jgi:hypothetical protein
MMADLAGGLLSHLTCGTGICLVFYPAILSGTLALLVKYLTAIRILPIYKMVSGGLLVLLASWYIDRICKNNGYLLVRSVGIAIILCAALGVVIVSEDGFADRRPGVEAQADTLGNDSIAGD